MKIETKYDISDNVWFMSNNSTKSALIVNWTISANGGNPIITYYVNNPGYDNTFKEHQLFPTKQDLLNSL